MARALAVSLAALALVAGCSANFLPPRGCLPSVCDSYAGITKPTLGAPITDARLGFVYGDWNPKLGASRPKLGAEAWASSSGPALNYEYYLVSPDNVKKAKSGSESVAACCHACRTSYNCPMFLYQPPTGSSPSTGGGQCFFVTGGSDQRTGPFDWKNNKPTSKRTDNLGSLAALGPGESKKETKKPGTYPGYELGFLGGYCNPHKYKGKGNVTDDPHFTGAHGTRFDFNGELDKAFCLVSDESLHLNAVLKGYKSDNTVGATEGKDGKAIRSWIREVGLIWRDAARRSHKLHLVARSGKDAARGEGFLASASLDGTPIAIPQIPGASFQAGDLSLTFLGTAKKGWYDVDKFQVTVGDQLDMGFNMRVAHPKLQAPDDAEVHFNLLFNDVRVSEKVHGVLGQTYRNTPSQLQKAVKYSELNRLLGGPVKADGASGAGFLEGTVTDYESSHVLNADCKVSAFSA